MQLITRFYCNAVRLFIGAALLFLIINPSYADAPDCTNPDNYPASIAFGALVNAGIITNHSLKFSKTKVIRLASEQIGKDLYRQVHYITFTEKSGKKISVITVNDVSSEECSMSGGQIFLVDKTL